MHAGQMVSIGWRTVQSSDVDASRVPSGLHAHESTVSSCPVVVAQVEIESKTRNQSIIFKFRALRSRLIQRGSNRVNPQRLTR